MFLNIILVVVLLILLYKSSDIIAYFARAKRNSQSVEKFDIKYIDDAVANASHNANDVLPDNSVVSTDNISSHELTTQDCSDNECAQIDAFRNKFFSFSDRINNSTHLSDAVDMVNITNKAQDYNTGQTIADIYDDLTKANKYKGGNSQCRIITPNI